MYFGFEKGNLRILYDLNDVKSIEPLRDCSFKHISASNFKLADNESGCSVEFSLDKFKFIFKNKDGHVLLDSNSTKV